MTFNGFYKPLFFLFVLSLTAAYGDTNIIVNPGFENGRQGWFDRTCSIEVVTSPVHNGSGSGKAFARGANWQGIKQSVFDKMMGGETYKISGWVRLDNAPNDTVAVSVEQQDDSGTHYYNIASAVATDSNWVKLSGEFTLNIRGTLSVLDVYFEGPMPGVNFYVDDVNVYGPEVIVPEPVPVEPNAIGVIEASIRHQKIEGFGASGAYYTTNFVNHTKKDELCNVLFKELALDIFRIRNNHDMEPNSFRETVEIAKAGEAALGHDLKIMVSSWSPPAYLKSNANTIGGTLKKKDGKYMYDEFAQWWYDSLAAYTKAGVKVDYINIQNELDYEAPWNSCQFTPTATTDPNLAAYDTAFETVWKKLNDEMGADTPKMLAPESSGLGNGQPYIENLGDLSHVYGYSHHLYDCSGCGSAPDRFIPRMVSLNNFVSVHGNKPIFQTEFEENPGAWADALNTAHLLHNSLTVEKVSGYLYWELFWGPGSGLVSLEDSSSYTITPTYYAFKHYSAFIHANWRRVEASTENTGLRLSAYISPDNKKLTAVIINITKDTDISLAFSLKDFSASEGKVYRSSQTENCVQIGKFKEPGPLKLPANSITTLVFSETTPNLPL
jgi:glucuronoarabinoxylan endo-1,4-beta-xylanase